MIYIISVKVHCTGENRCYQCMGSRSLELEDRGGSNERRQ